MTYERFIEKCLASIKDKLPENEIYFQYTYYPGESIVCCSYKFAIIGIDKPFIYISPNEEVCQLYVNKDNFKNMNSLNECLKELKEELL